MAITRNRFRELIGLSEPPIALLSSRVEPMNGYVIEQVFAAIEQFTRADAIAAAMRMAIENGRQAAGVVDRPCQDAAHILVAQLQAQVLDHIAIHGLDPAGQQRDGRLGQADEFAEAASCDGHAKPSPLPHCARRPTD